VVTPGGRFFDFLTGETVDVTQTFGGNPLLLPQTATTKRFGANAAPWREINLQLTAEYLSTRTSDFISSLPPASAAVLLAFPDRFIRDTKGVLTQVDVRPVNFERQTLDQLRYGLSFTVPIGPASAPRPRSGRTNAPSLPAEAGEGGEAPLLTGGPRPRLQVVANHTVLLNNGIVIREGLPIVDLLDGGAIGIAGGQPRHRVDFSLNFSDRGLGARFSGLWRSENTLELRQGGTVGTLRFAPLMTVNFTAFVEGTRVFEDVDFLRGTRFTFSVVNLANQRQQVTDSMGITPLNFQSAYRDPIGRTIEIGFRKAF
jgi:outer membrane receptor protein involved in Fe transport